MDHPSAPGDSKSIPTTGLFWLLAVVVVLAQLFWLNLVGKEAGAWLASPLTALLVCCGGMRRQAWVWLPVAVGLLLAQPLLDRIHGYELSVSWLLLGMPCYALFWMAGRVARGTSRTVNLPKLSHLLLGGLAAALVFYGLTNTLAWFGSTKAGGVGSYSMTWAGWWQAQTAGLPGLAPSWMFLRALVMAQLVFVPLIFGLVYWLQRSALKGAVRNQPMVAQSPVRR